MSSEPTPPRDSRGPGETRAFGRSPVHRMLGLELRKRDAAGAELALAVREEFLQEEGVVQGGILSALADAAAVYVLLPDVPPDRTMTSVEFKMNFLRPALLGRGELVARSELIRGGRTLALCRTVVEQAGRPVAEGLFTYLFSDLRPDGAARP